MRLADIEYRTVGQTMVVRVSGEIDMSNAADIIDAVEHATPNDALGVVLDLTEVGYLDSAGIHLLYRLRDGLGTRGQQLVLVLGDDSPVNDTLRLAGVRELIESVGTVEHALDRIDAGDKDRAANG
jgi:anti-anti-sigma factor